MFFIALLLRFKVSATMKNDLEKRIKFNNQTINQGYSLHITQAN